MQKQRLISNKVTVYPLIIIVIRSKNTNKLITFFYFVESAIYLLSKKPVNFNTKTKINS